MLSSVNNTVQPKVRKCFHFERGHCQRGQSCRFMHSEDHISFAETDHVGVNFQLPVPVEFQSSAANSKSHGSSVRVCKHFRQKGRCAFGDSCRFLHPHRLPSDEQHASAIKDITLFEHFDHLVTQSAADDVTCKPLKARGVTEKRICKFYKAGFCRYGQRCSYQHVGIIPKTSSERILVGGSSLKNQLRNLSSNEKQVQFMNVVDTATGAEQEEQDDRVDKKPATVGDVQGQIVSELQAEPHTMTQQDFNRMRETEIHQLCRRYPKAQEVCDAGQVLYKFMFEPTDPDWPFDVKQMNMEVSFPEDYPAQMMVIRVKGSDRIPASVESSLTESIQNWVLLRYNTQKTTASWELMFRPMLRWLDKNSEILMTDALTEYKRELLARAAGLEFIPAAKLRQLYPDAVHRSEPVNSEQLIAKETISKAEVESSALDAAVKLELNTAHTASEDDEDKFMAEEPKTNVLVQPPQKGTEVSLCGLQLTDGAATLVASQITLIVVCNRCTNTSDVHLSPGQIYQTACTRCHVSLLMEFNSTIAHQLSSVIGWLNFDGCRAFDLVMADSQFMIGCISCAKEEKVISLSPGHPNSTWCRHCHQKLTVFMDNVRFVHFSASVQIDASKAVQLEVKKRVKSVHDPAIQEGLPLPKNGTCRHYKKSFRWLRFPCCGKAYPCDKCHDEQETDHEMKLANRMICGFCAKEQAYATERPCVSCSNIMTNKSTAHWEGGKGCRDQIKMSRNDAKKYSNSMKTMSSSSENKTDSSKKRTKLRHV